jgi:nucleoside-diphosphate-sugar epimerase
VLAKLGAYGEALLASQRVTAAKARRELGWTPQHLSFATEVAGLYREWLAAQGSAAL